MIDKKEMQKLVDQLDNEVRMLEEEIKQKNKELEIKKVYASSARHIFSGIDFGVIKPHD